MGIKLAGIGLGSMALVTGVLVVVALGQNTGGSVSAEPRAPITYTPKPVEPMQTGIESADLAATMSKLNDAAQPLTITVLGDSTGNDSTEWVATLARTIASDKGRAVTYNAWDLAANTYAAPVAFGDGASAAPVTIWNGSASGMGPNYSLTNLPTLAARPSDLLIVSHGHNFPTPEEGAGMEAELIEAAAEQWQTTPAVAVIAQNPRTTNAEAQDANLIAVVEEFASTSYTVIDVAGAFRAEPDLGALLYPDGVHPDEDGQAIWTRTVVSALGL